MTRRTSTMMRIPNALVPAVRSLTSAWHAREREKKGYDGLRTAPGHDATEEECRDAARIALAEQDDGSDGND